jgi:osmotically-inducible protein OsmY
MKNAFKGSWLFMAVLILGLAGCAGSGEKSGAYVDDSWITTKVKSDMIADSEVRARHINVKTEKGVVTLTGTAANWGEANKAAEIAHGVAGVTAVQNDIRYD